MTRRKRKMLISGLIALILSTTIGMFILFQSDKILINFDIISLDNTGTNYKLAFNKVKAAEYYKVLIYDSSNIKVYEEDIKDNKVDLKLNDLVYNEEYSLMVLAYDKVGDFIPANNEYKFIYNEPTFNKENSLLLNNKDYILKIDGDITQKNYILKLTSNSLEVEYELKENEFKIDSSLYKDKEIVIKADIISDGNVIDSMNLYNNKNPLTNIKITSPSNDEIIPYNDLTLTYEGAEERENYTIKIFKNNKVIKTAVTNKKTAILSEKLFEIGKEYTISVTARYGEYTKESKVTIKFSDREKLNPVYISSNWKYVASGTKLELKTSDTGAKIYYTLDGKNPESFGTLYTNPIEITKNTTLKTVAVMAGKENSEVSTYDINVGKKTNLKVYLSPSNQGRNLGVSSTGYTNERDEMNDLSNYIEERLKEFGVKVIRNTSSGNINLWLRESNYAGVDLHIAIHSNASEKHDTYGVETWIHSETSKTYSLSHIIQDNLMSIYPYREKENADRGVKYANGALGEVNDNYLPFGILVEIAHHDNKEDAEWIMQNKKLIGYNIADSILKYYQIIE